jgi:peptide deformylase
MKLIYSPDPWLEKQVKEFNFDELDAQEVSNNMIDIMSSNNGIGLAANQVGIDAQIFVMKPHLLDDNSPLTIINPSIESVTINMKMDKEGCLSHPNLWLNIKRPRGLHVKYLDIHAKECTIELYDIDARCFLHEYDHLQGIEFTDRVSKLKLQMAKKKLHKQNKKEKEW